MAVAANIEWKVESALITVLGTKTDITSVARIARRGDAATVASTAYYPVVVVGCSGAAEEPFSALGDYSLCYVEIACMTYARGAGNDSTGSQVASLLGAVRDALYSATMVADLTGAVTGLTVLGIKIEDPGTREDDDEIRSRTLLLRVHARARDI